MMYNIFVADMPKSRRGKNIIFADDVSQIGHSRNKQLIQEYVEEEIFRLNAFEKKWKIRTSQEKFQIVAFERGQKLSFRVDATDRRKIIQDSNEGRFLGLFLNRNGLIGPAKRRSVQAKVALTFLQRFRGLSKCKKQLYTSLVKARLIYPCVPWAAQCDTTKCRIQAIQNKGVNLLDNHH